MSLFLAGTTILGIVVVLIVHKLKTNDPYGLKESRRAAAEAARPN
jgi:hypothetical protein